jgi:hypothetical protein
MPNFVNLTVVNLFEKVVDMAMKKAIKNGHLVSIATQKRVCDAVFLLFTLKLLQFHILSGERRAGRDEVFGLTKGKQGSAQGSNFISVKHGEFTIVPLGFQLHSGLIEITKALLDGNSGDLFRHHGISSG